MLYFSCCPNMELCQFQLALNFYRFHVYQFLACVGLEMQFELSLTTEGLATLRTLVQGLCTRLVLTCSVVFLQCSLGSKPHIARLALVLLMTLKPVINSAAMDISGQTLAATNGYSRQENENYLGISSKSTEYVAQLSY